MPTIFSFRSSYNCFMTDFIVTTSLSSKIPLYRHRNNAYFPNKKTKFIITDVYIQKLIVSGNMPEWV
jgi:hypothetical protein